MEPLNLKQGMPIPDEDDDVHVKWNRRHSEKKVCNKLCIILSVIIGVLAAALIALTCFVVIKYAIRKDNVCTTDSCYAISGKIYGKLNPTVEPCDNFEEFICGGYRKRSYAEGKEERSLLKDVSSKIDKATKEFLTHTEDILKADENISSQRKASYKYLSSVYANCLLLKSKKNTSNQFVSEAFENVLAMYSNYTTSNSSFLDLAAIFFKERSILDYVQDVSQHYKDSWKTRLLFDIHMLLTRYSGHVQWLVDSYKDNTTNVILKKHLQQADVFIKSLQANNVKIMDSRYHTEVFIDEQTINTTKFSPIQNFVNLTKDDLFHFLSKVGMAKLSRDFEFELLVQNNIEFSKFVKFIMSTTTALRSYLLVQTVAARASKHTELNTNQDCLYITRKTAEPFMFDIVKKYVLDYSQDDVSNTVGIVRKTARKMIEKMSGMGSETKQQLTNRMISKDVLIYYDQDFNEKLMSHLEKNPVRTNSTEASKFSQNRVKINRQLLEAIYGAIIDRKTFKASRLFSDSITSWWEESYNRFNFEEYIENTVYIFPKMLHEDFYSKDYPMNLKLGFLGLEIASEMSLSYSKFSEFNSEFKRKLTEKSQCVKEFVTAFNTDEELRLQFPAQLLVPSEISRLFGSEIAVEAMRQLDAGDSSMQRLPGFLSKFSPAQMYFIHGLQSMCTKWPNNYISLVQQTNVNAIAKMSKYFSESFKCKPEDKMYTDKNMCSIFS